MWSHLPFRKDVTPLGKVFAYDATMHLWLSTEANHSFLLQIAINKSLLGALLRCIFPVLAAECSALKLRLQQWWWECSDLNDLVQETFLLLLWWSAQWPKCCTPELLHSLPVGKQGRDSQKELHFSIQVGTGHH